MYRQERNTDLWFANPSEKSLSSSVTRNLGPGLYELNPQASIFQRTQSLLQQMRSVRCAGSCALGMVGVASGRLDAFTR